MAREKSWSTFPAKKVPAWYGWSADTHERGLKKLLELGLVERREEYKKAPLSPLGVTMAYQYARTAILRPRKSHKQVTTSATVSPTMKRATKTSRSEGAQ
ncbi:hypothetical protein [Streptomyces sp. Tu 3180]|uniref:hypothetical protein n=1 Tax=Streptomyces sp. Tu 3180 TaxID=2682611 RepID=UPI001AA09C42|nr:hypothetical protein [Streptomyces sp. Tu 3180]